MSFERDSFCAGPESEFVFWEGIPFRGGNVADLGNEGMEIAPVSVLIGVRTAEPLPHISQIEIKSEKSGGEEPNA
jgi:hypothetical protein